MEAINNYFDVNFYTTFASTLELCPSVSFPIRSNAVDVFSCHPSTSSSCRLFFAVSHHQIPRRFYFYVVNPWLVLLVEAAMIPSQSYVPKLRHHAGSRRRSALGLSGGSSRVPPCSLFPSSHLSPNLDWNLLLHQDHWYRYF